MPLSAHVRPKAFSNIRIQEPNTFLCAETAMNAQAREGVCHGKEFHRRPESYHINCFSFVLEFCHPIIESVHPPAPITPYPTGRLFWVALFQALRARLRSHRPSGTFCHRLKLDAVAKYLPACICHPSDTFRYPPFLRIILQGPSGRKTDAKQVPAPLQGAGTKCLES